MVDAGINIDDRIRIAEFDGVVDQVVENLLNAPSWHADAQSPHPLHFSSLICMIFLIMIFILSYCPSYDLLSERYCNTVGTEKLLF